MSKSSKDLLLTILAFVLLIGLANRCSSNSEESSRSRTYKKSAMDNLIVSMRDIPNFSILLYDMKADEGFNDHYYHKYQIIRDIKDSITTEITDWKEVSENYFIENEKNLGMEILSKKDGVISKEVAPAGYNGYVGNEKYGHWTQRSNGSSFWEFYGRYAMLRSVFHMISPTPYGYWNDYNTHYRRSGRNYYGSGTHTYGTYGNRNTNSQKNWNSNKSSSFKSRVNSRVSRSNSRSTRSSRTSRSSSRYRSSSFRSRGGGFGK
ncbi:hypothetical protein K4L44_03460 [Halosquirtibacter laminarini]|uniref:Uncharacterized protein n=1 Tax=Halosquirtibacter laminarini TaxID=3374600 RepID=A0AC61NGX4_9BACT|nr:hypothetical protein K4L44_03460 [Prolixibacteraceae bacterium]